MKKYLRFFLCMFILIILSSSLHAQERDGTGAFKNTYHVVFFKKLATINELAIIKSKTKEEIYLLKHVILKSVKLQEIGDNKFLIGKGIVINRKTDWQANRTVMIKWDLVTSIVGFNNYESFKNLTRLNPELELGN